MQVTISDSASQAPFSAPLGIRFDCHIAASVVVRVVDVQFQRPILVRFNQREQIFAFVQHWVRTNYVIGERSQTGRLGRRRRMHFQNVPHIFVGSLERTEANRDAEQTLAAPRGARGQTQLTHRLCFAAVHRHFDRLVRVAFEQLFQRVIVLVQPNVIDGNDEIEKCLQPGQLTWRIVLHLSKKSKWESITIKIVN